jgi:peptidoglycan/LPS O-acetylase OafA/YrhL
MFFYALVPLVWLIRPVRIRATTIVIASIVCLCSTLATSWLVTGSLYVADDTYLYYWFPTQAPVIFIGLICYFSKGSRLHLSEDGRHSTAYLIAFLLCLPAVYFLGVGGKVAPLFAPTILAVSFIFLIFALNGPLKQLVVNRLSVGIGKISFSVYILHFAVLDGLRAAFQIFHVDRMGVFALCPVLISTLALTSILALITKRFVEDPGVAFGHRLSKSIASVASERSQIPSPKPT